MLYSEKKIGDIFRHTDGTLLKVEWWSSCAFCHFNWNVDCKNVSCGDGSMYIKQVEPKTKEQITFNCGDLKMKVSINENKKKQLTAPHLLISKMREKIVLMVDDGYDDDHFAGVLLTNNNCSMVEYSTTWIKEAFEPFNGTIELSNDYE